MTKPLVVVESPAKAKTLSKFLGGDYDVRASVGHVADLPSKGMNIDVDNGFKPTYELTDRGKTVVKDLKSALKEASELYLATDEDREGEAIAWHLLEVLNPQVPVKRMVFHEITRDAILAAGDTALSAMTLHVDLVNETAVSVRHRRHHVQGHAQQENDRHADHHQVNAPVRQLIPRQLRPRQQLHAASNFHRFHGAAPLRENLP